MKTKFLIPILLSFALVQFSCSDTDVLTDMIADETTSGGILRTIESNLFASKTDPDNQFNVLVEIQDSENGDLTESIRVYTSFNNSNNTNVREEVLLSTVPNSSFVQGERLPTSLIEFDYLTLINALDLSDDLVNVNNTILVRLEIVFKDGRTWSVDNSSNEGINANPFFTSPFLYSVRVRA